MRPPVGSASTIHWFKSGKIIRKSTNPQFSKTYYVDPTGRFYNALDIRNLGATIDDVYTVTASNLGGTRKMDFRLVLASMLINNNNLFTSTIDYDNRSIYHTSVLYIFCKAGFRTLSF